MPRDNDKNNDSRGRRDRPGGGKAGGKGRSGAARGPEKKFAKRGFAGKSDGAKRDGERRPYAGKSDGAKSFGKKPYSGERKPMPASATARTVRRAATRRCTASARRPAICRPSVPRRRRRKAFVQAARGSWRRRKRPYTPRGDRPNFNRDDRAAAPVIATMRVRRRVCPTGNSATRSPTPHAKAVGEKRPYTPRGEGFRKDGDRPRAIGRSDRPSRDGDRPRGDRPERKFGGDKKFFAWRARPRPAQGFRQPTGSWSAIAAIQSRGRSARIAASATPVPPATARAISTSRASSRDDRGGEERPRFSRPREDRPAGDDPCPPSSIVRASVREIVRPIVRAKAAPTGRSIRAARPGDDVRAARTRTTARFLQSVRRSAAAAPIASASPNTTSARPRPPKPKKAGERIAKVVSRAGPCLAPRRRGMDHARPRHRQRPRHQFAGARRHRQRRHHRRRQAVAAARAHAAVPVSQAARPDDDACRSRGAADGVRQSARRPAAADHDRPARFQHRRPAAADQ